MPDRIPLDHLTSDQYDALHAELAALRQVARGYCPHCGRGDAAPTVADWEAQRQRADEAERERDTARQHAAAIAAQRDRLRQRMNALADRWDLEGPPPGNRPLTELRAEISVGPFHPDVNTAVQPYRADDGSQKWAARCWGADTCDGWLSLDHDSKRWAQIARDRHLADDHTTPGSAATQATKPDPAAGTVGICELPHQTVAEEDACEQQRLAAMGDPELTAEEARALADELGTDLYRAQDALAFVGECCDIADREQRPITTADVREWLKGARCGRQLATDATAATEATEPATITDPEWLRQQYAAALWEAGGPAAAEDANVDAVMRVRDRHLAQLRQRLDLADATLRQYTEAESADAAAGSYAGRAEAAEAFVTFVADTIADHEGDEWANHPATTTIRAAFPAIAHRVWTPPPPGDRREQLPDHLLDLIRPYLRGYTSTACQTAGYLAQAAADQPEHAVELGVWQRRMGERCRRNQKYTGEICPHHTAKES